MALITLAEYKSLVGVDPTDTRNDVRIDALIPAVSQLIETYCDRKFEVATGVQALRRFEYSDDDVVDIDDCLSITRVATETRNASEYVLTDDQWTAQPGDTSPTFYYIDIHWSPMYSYSSQMGFERNLDKYENADVPPAKLAVTANWGWQAVPADVKLATAWTIQEIITVPTGGSLASEGIEGWNRSWITATQALSIPNRARDVLLSYQRVF